MDIFAFISTISGFLPEKNKQELYDFAYSIFVAMGSFIIMDNLIGYLFLATAFFMYYYRMKKESSRINKNIAQVETSIKGNADRIEQFIKSGVEKEYISKECYTEFEFKNGFIPICNTNVNWIPVGNPNGTYILSFALLDSNKSIISVNPHTSWKQIHFNGSLAVIEMKNIKEGKYKIEFK